MSNVKRITALLLKEPSLDPNVQSRPDGSTALVSAVFHGYVEAAAMLLSDPRTDCNKTNFAQGSPLIISALHARPDCIRLLLARPEIDLNTVDRYGINALHYTVRAIAELMREQGSWFKKNLPALCLTHLDCLKQLLAMPRLDLGMRLQYDLQSAENLCSQYLSVLAMCIRVHLPTCVDLLLARGDVVVDEDALAAACIEPDNEAGYLAKLLLHANLCSLGKLVALWPANWDADCRSVIPARMGMSMVINQSLVCTGVLNKAGTKLLEGPTVGMVGMMSGPGHGEDLPALSTAARFGRSEHVAALLAAGASPSGPPGSRGSSPLMCALNYVGTLGGDGVDDGTNDRCICLLLAAPGIDLDACDGWGRTALDWAKRIPIPRGERQQTRVRLIERAAALAALGGPV